MDVLVIGGGAAGFFAAIRAAERGHRVTMLEAAATVLTKVRISGGGRCNVTHACFDPRRLSESYPRGGKALRGPFSRFQPADTVDWFQTRGVPLKTEDDGRMFPQSDDSASIVECLERAAAENRVRVVTKCRVAQIHQQADGFEVITESHRYRAKAALLATGGSRRGHRLAASLGHQIVPPVPSLFTFHVTDPRIERLSGISVDTVCRLSLPTASALRSHLRQHGPLLITHWGFSGPPVLKLSAWAARELQDCNYQAELQVDWLPGQTPAQVLDTLRARKQQHARKKLDADCPFPLPRRLWKRLVTHEARSQPLRWAEVSNVLLRGLADELKCSRFAIHGRSAFKEEFVTCGGVDLREVDFRTMESRLLHGLYFAGEILDVDGLTGGFNFQAAWTTAWIAAESM